MAAPRSPRRNAPTATHYVQNHSVYHGASRHASAKTPAGAKPASVFQFAHRYITYFASHTGTAVLLAPLRRDDETKETGVLLECVGRLQGHEEGALAQQGGCDEIHVAGDAGHVVATIPKRAFPRNIAPDKQRRSVGYGRTVFLKLRASSA